MPVQADLPSIEMPSGEALPNPVIPSDLDVSKKLFNDAMEAEKVQPSTEIPPAATDLPPSEQKVETKPETEAIPEKGTTDDKKADAETTPAAKAFLPDELITGKKPEPKVDDEIAEIDAMVLPKNAKPEQVASFSKLKAEAKRIIEERTARITELETKSSNGSTNAEVESAHERVKAAETKARELESTIERIAFTESPRFKQFIADETATLANAKTYFEGTEIDPNIIEYAARLKGSQRIKVLQEAGADPNIIAAVSPYLAQFDNIQRYKTGALENWKAEQGQFLEQQKAHQAAQTEQRRKAEDDVWTSTVSELKDLVPLRKFDKNDPWNSRADELLNKAKSVYNGDGVDLKTVAERLIKGEAYDALDEVRIAITDELNKVLQENARLKAAKPGASNGQVTATTSDEGLTLEEQAKRRFNQAMAAVKSGA